MATTPTVVKTKPPVPPTPFKRGSTFSFAYDIPAKIESGYFREWEVQAQIRKAGDTTDKGLISMMGVRWANATLTRRLYVFSDLTNDWPIGPAELDVLFINATGYRLRAQTIQVDIQRGITK